MKLLKIKTPRNLFNKKGAKIIGKFVSEDGSIVIQHLKHPLLGWDMGWDVLDGKSGKWIASHTSCNIHTIAKIYGLEEAF